MKPRMYYSKLDECIVVHDSWTRAKSQSESILYGVTLQQVRKIYSHYSLIMAEPDGYCETN